MQETQQINNVILENRSRLSVSGVREVESYDERKIILFTSRGRLCVKGMQLKLESLSVGDGEALVNGRIDSLEYGSDEGSARPLLSRLFG